MGYQKIAQIKLKKNTKHTKWQFNCWKLSYAWNGAGQTDIKVSKVKTDIKNENRLK